MDKIIKTIVIECRVVISLLNRIKKTGLPNLKLRLRKFLELGRSGTV